MMVKEYKILAVFALFLVSSLALKVDADNILKKVPQGSSADFLLTVRNPGITNATLSINSALPTSFTAQNLNFSGSIDTDLFVFTNWAKPGVYLMTATATAGNGSYSQDLVLVVTEGAPILRIDSQYASLSITPGASQDLKFTVTNAGKDVLRNVVLRSSIPQDFSPAYPAPFDLAPGAKDVIIRITAPQDYPEGDYNFTVRAGSGSIEESDDVRIYVQGKPSFVGAVDIQLRADPAKNGNDVTGYVLNVRLENRGSQDIGNLALSVAMPAGWNVSGGKAVSLRPFEAKDVQLTITPADFDEHSIVVSITGDGKTLASQNITLAGYRVGATSTTGAFLAGSGSLTVGLLVLAVALLVLLYVRQRNKYEDRIEDVKTKSYLTQLVDEAKKDFKRDEELKKEL